MSSIMSLCYQIDCSYSSAEYSKEMTQIASELSECSSYVEKWTEKLSELEDKKENGESYSIFDMKKCKNKVKMYERLEARLNKKQESLQKSNTIVSNMAEGFKNGASNVNEFSFTFA